MYIQRNNYSLLNHNTFGIDAHAASFIEYTEADDIVEIVAKKMLRKPYLHIGSGSNLLFTGDFEGTVLHSAIKDVTVIKENASEVWVKVGAGVVWDDFVSYCVSHLWYGVENLSLIPGEVGAAAVQNIGAYGVEAKDVIQKIDAINSEGQNVQMKADAMNYSYRQSIFKQADKKNIFITYVYFKLGKQKNFRLEYGSVRTELAKYTEINLGNVREAIISIRQNKLPDPALVGNAGSFFMNPIIDRKKFETLKSDYPDMPHYNVDTDHVKVPAGWMIEQCGWKGRSLGKAGVYDKQALVLVNLGGATGNDIMHLCNQIRKDVSAKFAINIHPEVNFI